ncbi:hypothetical protein HRbin29_02103 [bacterium HR29]|nr:hypothetical protein HRbin29_02103 [bacterium HR29]
MVRPTPEGEPRRVRLGFSTLPPEATTEAYIRTFAAVAQYADTVLIQRPPPWEDFFPNRQLSAETEETTRVETALLAQYPHLQLFYAIDPTDPLVQRSRPANLPAGVSPEEGFRNPQVRNALVAYTAYVVTNYRPAYLAIGVEINMLRDRAPEQFEAFLQAYRDAYDAAKAADPRVKVFPTFQLEDLEGNLGRIHPPQWDAIEPFRGRMDALAISTYPYLSGIRTASELPAEYYSQLRAHWDGEIIIAEAGYASAPVEGQALIGTEADQAAFLQRLLEDAERNGFSLVVYRAVFDPAYVTTGAASVFRDIGLRRSDGSNKEAWALWEAWARRPLAP